MQSSFSFKGRRQNINGYGDQPFTFVDPEAHRIIGHIASIDLIENGDKAARANWQRKQLSNLTNHAYMRSEFWRRRIPSGVGRQDILQNMPVLTRTDVALQVRTEGSLFGDKKKAGIATYETTGSTGTPLKVFICEQNGYYNITRSFAQFFFDDLPLDENRVLISPVIRADDLVKQKTVLHSSGPEWAGPLSKIYQNGSNKVVRFNQDIDGLIEEISKDRVGYLVCHSRVVEHLLNHGGPDLVKGLGVKLWIHASDYRSRDVVEKMKQIGIPSLSNYSSGEIGPIAFECKTNEGYYHVAHSNVILECDQRQTTTFEGETVGRLLITHLHSYATPLIRYDIGDFGKLHEQCPCGHDGPAVSHIYGRGKHFLRHPDGKYMAFYLSTRVLREAVEFDECRFRQDTIDTISVQIGGREALSPEEEAKLTDVIHAATDPVFRVVIKPVKKIDWSDNPKQLFFSSSVATD
jgi:phenylacetate-coenzyme A ligase PaaK-like adenylate-forming protein